MYFFGADIIQCIANVKELSVVETETLDEGIETGLMDNAEILADEYA